MTTTTEKKLVFVCSWCGRDKKGLAVPTQNKENLTHGICPPCKEKVLGDLRGKQK